MFRLHLAWRDRPKNQKKFYQKRKIGQNLGLYLVLFLVYILILVERFGNRQIDISGCLFKSFIVLIIGIITCSLAMLGLAKTWTIFKVIPTYLRPALLFHLLVCCLSIG